MSHNSILIVGALALIALDIITGLIKAIQTGAFSSKEMRAGLIRKSGTIILLLIAYGIQYAAIFLPELPSELSAVFDATALYIILMELASNIENILVINPELGPEKIRALFGLNNDKKQQQLEDNDADS